MKRWYPLIPLLLAIIVYAPAPLGGLVWDDQLVLDKQLIAFNTVQDAFFPPKEIFQWSPDYYRPIVILSYMLDSNLYGDARTAGMHISNVLCHVVTTFFVWLLVRRLLRHLPNGSAGAIVAASVFAVHPIHTESVSWITGRSDLLATMFFVPSVSLALLWRDSGAKWALTLGALLYFLSLLSKEVAIAALIMVPATLLLTPPLARTHGIHVGTATQAASRAVAPGVFRHRTNVVMWLSTAIMYLGVTGFYIALRQADGIAYGAPLKIGWFEYFARLEKSISYYLVKVLVPWPQSNHVAWDLTPGFVLTNLAFFTAIVLLGLGIWSWRQHRDGSLLLAMTWFAATLAPSLLVAVRSISGTPLAERYLYLPSVSVALLFGFICCQTYVVQLIRPATWAAILLMIFYSITTVERGIVWTNDLRLWTDATEKAPHHAAPWNLLGIAYQEQHEDTQAINAFLRAIDGAGSPMGRSFALRNIAVTYHKQNDLRRAKDYYSRALDEYADNPEAHYGLGVIYMTEALGDGEPGAKEPRADINVDLAATHFRSTLRLNPYHSLARWGLASALVRRGESYEKQGKRREAATHYRSAMAEIETLIAQDPTYRARMEVQNKRAELRAAAKRLAD